MVDRSLTLGTLFTANVTEFISKIDMMKRKVGQLNATMASIGKQTRGISSATAAVGKMDKGLGAAGQSSKGFSAQLGLMGTALTRVGQAAKTTASFFAAGLAIGAITKGLAAGTREIIDFDQALKNLQAITKSTDAEVAGMGEVIKRVATETKFSTGEVAEGMVLLGQAGFNVTEAMQSMASVANLATGTLANLRVTSDLLTTTIRAFNLSTVESARVADVMANAINRSKLTIDKLRIAFNFVGAASAQAGLSLEETAASMMVLANNGIRASTIGTGLRQVMSRLLAPNKKLREEFQEQGIALDQISPSMVGWSTALKNLIPILIDSETGLVNMGKAYRLFGLRGAQAAAIMAKAVASGNYQKMIEYTYEVGAAARMAETQMEGLGVKLKNLADRLKLVAVAIGEAGLTDAFKLLIDALRGAAKAVADFASSDTGKVTLALVGWMVAIGGVVKILRVLISVIGAASLALKAKFITALISTGGASALATGGLIGLIHATIRLVGTFGGLTIALGFVLTAINYFVNSINREISALEKYDTKTQTVIQTLELFQSKLEDLAKKRREDVDISEKHSKEIERFQQGIKELEKDYDELNISLDRNVEALDKNLEATRRLARSELYKTIQTQTELIDRYNKQIERANFWSAVWNRTNEALINVWRGAWIVLNDIGNLIIDAVVKAFEKLAEKIREVSPALSWVVDGVVALKSIFDDFWKGQGRRIDAFVSYYAKKTKEVENLTETQRAAFVRFANALNKLDPNASIDRIVQELETITNMKLDTKTIDDINESLKKVTGTLGEQKDQWNETYDSIPGVFKRVFDSMDLNRKVDSVQLLKKLAQDVAAWEKQAEIIGATDAEINAGRIAIYAKGIAAAEERADKEVEISEKAADRILEGDKYLVEETEKIYNQASKQAINRYFAEYDEAAKSKQNLLKLENRFSKEMETIAQTREKSLQAIAEQNKGVRAQLEKQTIKEIRDLNLKMYKDLASQLKSRIKEAQDDLKETQGNITDLEEERRQGLREINEKSYSEEQKYLADREEAYYMFNKARETGEEQFYDAAKTAAKSLAREVTDSQGKVVRDLTSGQSEARDLFLQIVNSQIDSQRRLEAEQKRTLKNYKEDLETVQQKFRDLKAEIDNLSSTELILKMEETLRDLNKAHNITSEFRSEWDALKSKTITLTVKYKYVGGPPVKTVSEGEPNTLAQADQAAEEITTERWGGIIRRRIGGAIRHAFDIGGKLRGYGGGDKVKALLEPGEYVVRKEAVKKYGEGLFSALNNMRVGSEDVGSTVAQRIGGIIKKMAPQPMPVQTFASGGPVASASSFEPARSINVYLQPKFLTGDRRSMRVAAVEIQKALTDLDSRWGKR